MECWKHLDWFTPEDYAHLTPQLTDTGGGGLEPAVSAGAGPNRPTGTPGRGGFLGGAELRRQAGQPHECPEPRPAVSGDYDDDDGIDGDDDDDDSCWLLMVMMTMTMVE